MAVVAAKAPQSYTHGENTMAADRGAHPAKWQAHWQHSPDTRRRRGLGGRPNGSGVESAGVVCFGGRRAGMAQAVRRENRGGK